MRSSSGGWVANSPRRPSPSPNSMWLTSSALPRSLSREPASRPAIFFSAPARPWVCRVNCTAEASASRSRVRLTPALISRPKNSPT